MRSQEVINRLKEAQQLEVCMVIDKGACYSDANTVMSRLSSRGEMWEYISNVNEAFITIKNTEKVVNTTMKKLESLGFTINVIESAPTSWGTVNQCLTIKRQSL